MKKLILALLFSTLLCSAHLYADDAIQHLESKTIDYFASQNLSEKASLNYLEQSFDIDEDTFLENATVIHSLYSPEDYSGMPFAFAFNQGRKIVGIGGAVTTESTAFFNQLSKLTTLKCSQHKASFYILKVCVHQSAQPAVVKKFSHDFIELVNNAG